MLKQLKMVLMVFIVIEGIDLSASSSYSASPAKPDRRSTKQLPVQPVPDKPQIVKGDILVNFKLPPLPKPLDEKILSERRNKLTQLVNQLTATHKAELRALYSAVGTALLKASPEMVNNIIAALKKDPATIAFATPNYRIYGFNSPPPRDSKWISGELWNLEKIGMKRVWDSGLVESEILIAVIDSGIDYTHPDLKDNIWNNPIPSASGDVHGMSYCDGMPSGDPMDEWGHGTHVAGIVAARGDNSTDNATDLVGVNWKAKLMAVKVLCKNPDGSFSGTLADAIAGMDYALQKSSAILNTSWGFSALSSYDIEILNAVISDANTQNVLIVASAGNSNKDIGSGPYPQYPASITADNLITVAASTSDDNLWESTNYGINAVHLAAPGEYIVSTFPGAEFSLAVGTSAAAPHVAGCAALLQAKRLKSSLPLLTPRELRKLLMDSGDDMGPDRTRTISGKRLNCSNAMDRFSNTTDSFSSSTSTSLRVH